MKNAWFLFAAALCVAPIASAQDRQIPIFGGETPGSVRQAVNITKLGQLYKIKSIVQGVRDGKMVYEVDFEGPRDNPYRVRVFEDGRAVLLRVKDAPGTKGSWIAANSAQEAPTNVVAKDQGKLRAPEAKQQVLDLDRRRVEAAQKDPQALAAFVSDDVYAFDGVDPYKEQIGKKAYLAHAAERKVSPTAKIANATVRIFGADENVAVVLASLIDSAIPNDKGLLYTAVYAKNGPNWSMIRYQLTATDKGYNLIGTSEIPPGPMDTGSNLSGDEQKIFEKLQYFYNVLPLRAVKGYNYIFADPLMYINGETGGNIQTSVKQYVDGKNQPGAGGAPEVLGLANPRISVLGAQRDVAVSNNMRADATGGVAMGMKYTPAWRSVQNNMIVWVKVGEDDWRIVHHHIAPYPTRRR